MSENWVLSQTNSELADNKIDDRGELLFVQLIFRHGDRTPLKFYKNDPWKDAKYWDDDTGQLTNLGKQQQFELGQYMRDRYSKFLNETYSDHDIYVQSSDIDRTLMSAEAFLAAMYRPKRPTDIWNRQLPWQPIPIHTTQLQNDHLIIGDKSCDAFREIYRDYKNSDEIKKFNAKHAGTYDYLSLHTGDAVKSIRDAVPIRDTTMIEAIHNKTLPDWTKQIFPGGDFYGSIEEIALTAFKLDTNRPFLAKIKGGFLLKEVFDRFTNKSKSILDPDRKFWVYSGHDTTICRVLNTLGLLETLPPFSTCIMFEMRNIKDVPHIEIFLKNSSQPAVPLHIPQCGVSCPLADLYNIYKDVLPTKTFEEECIAKTGKHSRSNKNSANVLLLTGILSVLLTTILYIIKA